MLSCIVEMDAAIEELHDLPCGWIAELPTWMMRSSLPSNAMFYRHPPNGDVRIVKSAIVSSCSSVLPKKIRHTRTIITELMWVKITEVDADNANYTEVIDNEPVHSVVASGDELKFIRCTSRR